MRHLSRHADALAQRGVRVNGFADAHRVGAQDLGAVNSRGWSKTDPVGALAFSIR